MTGAPPGPRITPSGDSQASRVPRFSTPPARTPPLRTPLFPTGALIATILTLAACLWAVFSTWQAMLAVGDDILAALWTLPALVALHLVQLLLSAIAWRRLLDRLAPHGAEPPGLARFFRLRVEREGIDGLLPVAQIGGEVIAAGRLARDGMPPGLAGASIVVDLTLEVLSQFVFLLAGLACLASRSADSGWHSWIWLVLLAAAGGFGLLAAQRLGALRLIEGLMAQIAARFPALGGTDLRGLHSAALGLYRRRRALLGAGLLHLLAWALGTAETAIVLRALGSDASLVQCLVVESLGMAARSAGFAVPGALVVQEGGFMLAAIAAGLPPAPGLSLSLVKRAREILVGVAGIALWRLRR